MHCTEVQVWAVFIKIYNMHPFPQAILFLGIYPKGALAMPYLEHKGIPRPCGTEHLPRAPPAGRTVCTPSGVTPLDPEVEAAPAYIRIERSLSALVMSPTWSICRTLGCSRTRVAFSPTHRTGVCLMPRGPWLLGSS